MSKKFYKYNPNTLSYEIINKSCKSKLLKFISIIFSGLIVTLFLAFVSSKNIKSIKFNNLQKENIALVDKYEALTDQISQFEEITTSIATRDDHIYRPLLDKNPLPENLRNAGIGGTNRYEEFKKYNNYELLKNSHEKVDILLNKLKVQKISYNEISELVDDKILTIDGTPAIQPISVKDFVRISSYFGRRIDPVNGKRKMHKGLDFPAKINTPIYATADGKITMAAYSKYGYGNEIIVEHHGGYTTIYAHLNKILVKKGQKVKRGELIGLLGNTGKSTGPHLHYEVRTHGKAVDPINYYFNNLSVEEYEQIIKFTGKKNED